MRLIQRLYAARQDFLPGALFVSIGLMTCGAAEAVVLFIALHMNTTVESPLVMVRAEELPETMSSAEVVRLLAHEVAARLGVDGAVVESAALLREESEPTYVGRGMAVPHARVSGLPMAAMYVARSRKGILWGGGEARLVVFTAAAEEKPEQYLQLLSAAMRWRLRFPGGEEALLAADLNDLLPGLKSAVIG